MDTIANFPSKSWCVTQKPFKSMEAPARYNVSSLHDNCWPKLKKLVTISREYHHRVYTFSYSFLIHDGEYDLRISKLVCQWIIREMQWMQQNEIIRLKLPIKFANRASAIDNWICLPKSVDKGNRRLKSLQTISSNNSYSSRCQLIESRNVFWAKEIGNQMKHESSKYSFHR